MRNTSSAVLKVKIFSLIFFVTFLGRVHCVKCSQCLPVNHKCSQKFVCTYFLALLCYYYVKRKKFFLYEKRFSSAIFFHKDFEIHLFFDFLIFSKAFNYFALLFLIRTNSGKFPNIFLLRVNHSFVIFENWTTILIDIVFVSV